MPKLPKIDLADLGVSLHTALRKYCDSAPTSIAWNAIEIMSPEAEVAPGVGFHKWVEYFEKLSDEDRATFYLVMARSLREIAGEEGKK